ncbi:MAG: DUF4290 domain-containing protein [Chitinophagaceae bacterium]|jgi:hypothetical protein
MEYNTSRTYLGMREYGRHIQKMVDFLQTIEDKDKRNEQAKLVIELMGLLNPHLKIVEDFRHMLWDHLFVMSDFKLDVDSPYPIPEKETYKAKTQPMGYPKRKPKFNHLGKNIELVINKALAEEDQEKRNGFANAIAYYMKLSYSSWHNELVADDQIRNELQSITKGQLDFDNTPYIKHTPRIERDDFGRRSNKNRQKNFGGRNNGNNNQKSGGQGNGQKNNNNNNRNSNNGNRNNNQNNNNRNNQNFKKRY